MLSSDDVVLSYKNFMIVMLTKLMHLSIESEFSLNLFFVIQAKIARRVFKLETIILDFVSNDALIVAHKFMSKTQTK